MRQCSKLKQLCYFLLLETHSTEHSNSVINNKDVIIAWDLELEFQIFIAYSVVNKMGLQGDRERDNVLLSRIGPIVLSSEVIKR